jgi:TetR/AcrR family transcriptional repressor of mexJK operon
MLVGVGHGEVQSRDYRCVCCGCACRGTGHIGLGASASRLAGIWLGRTGCCGGSRRRHDRDRPGPRLGLSVLCARAGLLPAGSGLLLPAGSGLLCPVARLLRATSGLLRTLSGGSATTTAPLRRGGRPSREAAALLGERILDVATELFLAEGYGATSIEAVAQHARISKRTFYHRFPDKAALFGAVVHRIIEELRPPAGTPLYEGRDLEEVLGRLARLMLRAVLMPMALALNRLMVAEAQRFPELAAIVGREGGRAELVGHIAAMFEREARAGGLAIDRPAFAAEQFLQLVVSLPQRRALGLGTAMTEAELDAWADDCVNLFLNGCRFWQPRASGSQG